LKVIGLARVLKSIYSIISLLSLMVDLFWKEMLNVLPTNRLVVLVIGDPFIVIRFIWQVLPPQRSKAGNNIDALT